MATLTFSNKDIASFKFSIKHGRDTVLNDIKDMTFTDVAFPDGTQLKDVTFAQLSEEVWTYANKNNANLTYTAKS